MAFGDRLQEVRKRSGLTQEEFAEQLQVSRQAVSKWESGRGYPEMEKLLYICSRCGTTMDELFADELPKKDADEPREGNPSLAASSFKSALGNFYNNLSPYNKLIGGVLLVVIVLLGPAYAYVLRVLKGGTDDVMTAIWLGALVVFAIAEAATAGLVSIWFVGGSAAAMIAAAFGAPLWLQFLLFLAVSVALLFATRPLAHRMREKVVPTNADRVLHHTARVTETVDNARSAGAVYIDGKTWTARSEDGSVIAKDTLVDVVRMEGVKLFVVPEKKEV